MICDHQFLFLIVKLKHDTCWKGESIFLPIFFSQSSSLIPIQTLLTQRFAYLSRQSIANVNFNLHADARLLWWMYTLWGCSMAVRLVVIATTRPFRRSVATKQGTDWAQVQSNPPFPFPFSPYLEVMSSNPGSGIKFIRINLICNSNLSSFGICHILLVTYLSLSTIVSVAKICSL